ncbi:protein-glutamine gamma-glutamyltransferase [Gorillibacterium massiliense]|uniref:protein-glutamine gamma-glutamyltransferase n=1 Tax=Gorillibacterium massiliense TaxID=1280390 RepID=UPI0004B69DF0|nr:protein-glutamine gamma-glutamyltransferase [Gorillibacterium massiliense]
MIVVAGGLSSVDRDTFTPLERQIYDEMNESNVPLYYTSLTDLMFELGMRAHIVESAEALSQSGIRFSDFSRSQCNDAYWIRTPNGGFRLRYGIPSADGIRDIFANGNLYSTECATAVVIVLYHGVLQSIGDNSFNANFADLLLYDWQYDQDLKLYTKKKADGVFPGDVVYFKNPGYDPRTPWWIGENTIKLLGDQYYGHGAGIKSEEEMISNLNDRRAPNSQISAYMSNDIVGIDYPFMMKLAAWNGPALAPNLRMFYRPSISAQHGFN